jgi:hypothetical protein
MSVQDRRSQEESSMSVNHDEQQGSPNVQKPEGSRSKASRRQFLQFSEAAVAVAAGGLAPSAAFADDDPITAGLSKRPSWAPTKYLTDCHSHIGAGPTVAKLAEGIHSPADWGAVRTKQPELFAKAMSEDGVDNSEHLLRAMDKYGVTHAIIQTAPGKGITNQMVLDAAKKSAGRPRVLRWLQGRGHAQRQCLLRHDRHLGGAPA